MTAADIVDKCEGGFYRIKQANGSRRFTLERWLDEERGWLIGVPLHPAAAKVACRQLIECRGTHTTTWAR